MAPPPPSTDPHQILGLSPGASPDEIKSAWRRFARKTHPDLHPGDPDAARRFREGREAFEALVGGRARKDPAAGPDEDWLDACAWMAEAHFLHLRTRVLPRYCAVAGGGPALAQALSLAASGGLEEAAPEVVATPFARAWSWWTFRRLRLTVVDGTPGSGGPVMLERRGRRLNLFIAPMALWRAGVREEEVARRILQNGVEMGISAAAPFLMGMPGPPHPQSDLASANRIWWVGRLFWPVVWTVVLLLSAFLIHAGLSQKG